MRIRCGLLCLMVVAFFSPATVYAEGSPSGPYDRFGNTPIVDVKVTTNSSGAYIEISVHQTVPGTDQPAPPAGATPQPASSHPLTAIPQPTSSHGDPRAATPASDRTWSDETGIYRQTADGHLYYLTIPDLSSTIDWKGELESHPNQTPYTLYVDDQFQGVIWIPSTTNSGDIHLGPPPSQPVVPPNPPAGNASSTDPHEVALDLLDHVPLPTIQIKMNPALGLVALPGWFWIDGYDGKPFGTARTVTVPPAVGPEVPFTVVPRDDPRRQPTSFTVSVRVWPTSYQWSFGDGSSLATDSLGTAYPAVSNIQHTYAYSSLHFPNGFPVKLTVVFNASYQVNGGVTQGLPPIAHTYSSSYPVQEAQAILESH